LHGADQREPQTGAGGHGGFPKERQKDEQGEGEAERGDGGAVNAGELSLDEANENAQISEARRSSGMGEGAGRSD
jgi:hypothetical protein